MELAKKTSIGIGQTAIISFINKAIVTVDKINSTVKFRSPRYRFTITCKRYNCETVLGLIEHYLIEDKEVLDLIMVLAKDSKNYKVAIGGAA